MLGVIVEILLSFLICVVVAYFFFLSVPVEERHDCEKDRGAAGVHGQRGTFLQEGSQKCEGATWCNVLGRWAALLLLGGGSLDKDVWTDRIAYFLEKAVKNVSAAIEKEVGGEDAKGKERGRNEHSRPDIVCLGRVELGCGGPLNAASNQHHHQQQQQQQQVGGVVGNVFAKLPESGSATPLIGVVLPRVGPSGIVSAEIQFNAPAAQDGVTAAGDLQAKAATIGINRSLRCFEVPIIYEDQRFALQLLCNIPLLFALPKKLSVPADVLTLRCALKVRSVRFHAVLHAAFYNSMVELSFATAPEFTASFDVDPVGNHYRKQQQQQVRRHDGQRRFTTTGGFRDSVGRERKAYAPPHASSVGGNSTSVAHRSNEKMQEIVDLAVKRAVQLITYPQVLRGCVGSARNFASTNKNTADEATVSSRSGGLVAWTLDKATLPLGCR